MDGTGAASNDSQVVTGDWGVPVCGIEISVLSHRALRVRYNPLSLPMQLPRRYQVEYGAVDFVNALVTVVPENDSEVSILGLSRSPGVAGGWYFRVVSQVVVSESDRGVLLPFGPLQPMTTTYPTCACGLSLSSTAASDTQQQQLAVCTARLWANNSVDALVPTWPARPVVTSVRVAVGVGAGSGLATIGGGAFDVNGLYLGVSESLSRVVRLIGSLSGFTARVWTVENRRCVLVDPEGRALRCTAPPGTMLVPTA